MMKMTKKEMFAMVIEVVNGAEIENKNEMLEFLNHEIELLEKKNSRTGQTKVQKENEVLKVQLVEALAEMPEPMTISEFQEKSNHEVATLSNQKLSALLRALEKEGKIVKEIVKRRSYFSIVRE